LAHSQRCWHDERGGGRTSIKVLLISFQGTLGVYQITTHINYKVAFENWTSYGVSQTLKFMIHIYIFITGMHAKGCPPFSNTSIFEKSNASRGLGGTC
jgi:hypothetical protein